MKIIFNVLASLTLVWSFSSQAGSSIDPTKITQILIGPKFGNNVIIEISGTASNRPNCHTNQRWDYVFDGSTESGKATLSVVLAAYATQKDVWLAGAGGCGLYGGLESLDFVVAK